MTTTQTGITTEMCCVAALGDGAFMREQTTHVTAAFSNVFIEGTIKAAIFAWSCASRQARLSGARLNLNMMRATGCAGTSKAKVCVNPCIAS